MARVIRCSNFFNSIRNNLVIQESMEYTLDRILQCRALLQRKNQFHVQIYTAMHTYKTYSILLNFALLCFIDVAFLQIEGKTLYRQKDYDSFIVEPNLQYFQGIICAYICVIHMCVCVRVAGIFTINPQLLPHPYLLTETSFFPSFPQAADVTLM